MTNIVNVTKTGSMIDTGISRNTKRLRKVPSARRNQEISTKVGKNGDDPSAVTPDLNRNRELPRGTSSHEGTKSDFKLLSTWATVGSIVRVRRNCMISLSA